MPHYKLMVCTNVRYNPKHKSCAGQGSEALIAKLREIAASLNNSIEIEEIKCFGQCDRGPVMRIAPALEFFYQVNDDNLLEIIEKMKALK